MKRFVTITLIVLAVSLIGGGAFYFLVLRNGDGLLSISGSPTPTTTPGLQPAQEADLSNQASLDADEDNDGLSNRDELVWKTDPLNPDTDGDGYLDGEEVAARHDPRIPAPNDLLDDQVVSTGGTLDNIVAPDPVSIEPYVTDNYSASISEEDLTEIYESTFKEEDRNQSTRDEFLGQQIVSIALPKIDAGSIKSSPANAALISEYLNVANSSLALANSSLYVQSQISLIESNTTTGFREMVKNLEDYRSDLEGINVPDVAINTQQLLLGYSTLLIDTFKQVEEWNDDQIKALVALQQAEAADRTYYPLIRDEFLRLQLLQTQLANGS